MCNLDPDAINNSCVHIYMCHMSECHPVTSKSESSLQLIASSGERERGRERDVDKMINYLATSVKLTPTRINSITSSL